jgi:hypothetical protein
VKTPVATLSEFTYLIQGQWSRFANFASTSDEVYVLEAVFFQYQIHDLLRHYQVDDYQIEQHIKGIADQIAAMNPVLIYLAQPSVREQQVWISPSVQNITTLPNKVLGLWRTASGLNYGCLIRCLLQPI